MTLCDGRSGLRGGLQVEVRASSPEQQQLDNSRAPVGESHSNTGGGATLTSQPVLDFLASSEALDRYSEVILSTGWRLEAYRRNPVFQNAHQYGDVIFTLGKALITEVRDGRLYQRVEFAVEVNPMARIAYGLYRGGFLNAVSVGFIPLRWENGGPGDPWRRRYLEQELLEVSAVGIPANPEALQLGLKSGAVQKADLRELLELLQMQAHTISVSNPVVSGPHAGASGAWSDEAQLLQLAREVRRLLRRA
jgi:HK97 family phage prohead protease